MNNPNAKSPLPKEGPATVIALRPYSLKELTSLYGVCARTFRKWLAPFEKQVGKRQGNFYNIRQVRKIFELLAFPSVMEES